MSTPFQCVCVRAPRHEFKTNLKIGKLVNVYSALERNWEKQLKSQSVTIERVKKWLYADYGSTKMKSIGLYFVCSSIGLNPYFRQMNAKAYKS
jgi:hypothetical protein